MVTDYGTVMQQRRDNATNWDLDNPVLLDGVIGYDTTNKSFRIGDGTSHWTSLHEFNYGSVYYMGVWEASSGSFPLYPEQGQYYVVSANGTVSAISYEIGDWIVYSGVSWQKINNKEYATVVHTHSWNDIIDMNEVNGGVASTSYFANEINGGVA